MGYFDRKLKRTYDITSSDDPRFWRSFPAYGPGMAVSTSGTITPDTARTFLTFFACVALRARTIGSLQCHVARDTGSVFEPVAHYINDLLDLMPNAHTTEFNFFETCVHHLDLWGNFYAVKQRKLGRYVALQQISDPASVWPYFVAQGQKTLLWDNTTAFPGQLVYEVRRTDGQTTTYPASKMLHIANISQNGIVGLSQLGIMRETMGKYLSAQKYQAERYGNTAMQAAGVVTYGQAFDPETETESIKNIQARMEAVRVGGIAVLDDDLTYTQLKQMPLTDAQFVESQQFDAYTVCGWLGVPPHKVGLAVTASYNSIETQNGDFKDGCIFPLGTRISKTLTNALLEPEEIRAGLRVVFDYDTLFKADKASRATYNRKMFEMGTPANVIMARENLPPLAEGGDISFRPANLIPITAQAQNETATEMPVDTETDPNMDEI